MKLIKGERGIMNTLQWLVIKVKELLNKQESSSGGGSTSGDFIPLTGTEEGKPVTGDIEMNGGGFYRRISVSDEDIVQEFLLEDSGSITFMRVNETTLKSTVLVILEDAILANQANNENFRGFSGVQDYSDKITNLDYPQKKYVDRANSYSTEEIKTGGTWIDGKPIYRKVILHNTPRSGVENIDIASLNIESLIRSNFSWDNGSYIMEGFLENTYLLSGNILRHSTYQCVVASDKTSILLNTSYLDQNLTDGSTVGSAGIEITAYQIILEYTKTTD